MTHIFCSYNTADQVLHNGYVVSNSDRFGMTAIRMPVSHRHHQRISSRRKSYKNFWAAEVSWASIFLDESVKAGSGPPLLWEFLHQMLWATRLFKSQTNNLCHFDNMCSCDKVAELLYCKLHLSQQNFIFKILHAIVLFCDEWNIYHHLSDDS